MNQSTELLLEFLGKRTYLQGTTLFDALADHCRHGRSLSFRISRLMESDRVGIEPFDPNSAQTSRYSATLVWEEGEARIGLGIVPLVASASPKRVPFDEDAIVKQAEFREATVTTHVQAGNTLVRNIVALNKAMLLRLLKPPAPGQWLFVRLDLDRYVDMFNTLRLTLRSNAAFVAVSSSIEVDGRNSGTVVFSWLKK